MANRKLMDRLDASRSTITNAYKYRGATGKKLAKQYGCSHRTMCATLQRWGVKKNVQDMDKIFDDMIGPYYEGVSLKKLSKLSPWGHSTFLARFSDYRIARGLKSRAGSNVQQFKDDYANVKDLMKTETIPDIAKTYDIDHNTARKYMEEMGLLKIIVSEADTVSISDLRDGAWKSIDSKTIITVNKQPKFFLVPYN